jgi:hypothetical protein
MGRRKGRLALPRLQGICFGPNDDGDDALRARAGARQFCYWLEYDAAEPEGNERKLERTAEGEGMEYLSRTVDIVG